MFTGAYKYIFVMFKREILFTSFLVLYISFTTLYPEGDQKGYITAYKHVVWFAEGFIIPLFFITFYRKQLSDHRALEKIVIVIGAIAALISVVLIVKPNLNIIMRDSIIIDGLDYYAEYSLNRFRGFSFADGSSGAYGVVQGMLFSIWILSFGSQILYSVIPIAFLISIMFNARVGFIPAMIGLGLLVLKQRRVYSIIGLSVIVLLGYRIYFSSTLQEDNYDTVKWSVTLFNQTKSFFTGSQNSSRTTYDYLFSGYFMPKSAIDTIVGEGRNVFGYLSKNGQRSDIGYVIELHKGGILYIAMILSFIAYMFKRYRVYTPNKLYAYLFFGTLLLVNIKADALFLPNSYSRLISLFYVFSIYSGIFNRDIGTDEFYLDGGKKLNVQK